MRQKQGLIAILDALGAATYSPEEISQFLKSRQRVLDALQDNAEAKAERGKIDASRVTTFTFNDTVLVVYQTDDAPSLDDVRHFCLLLRKFEVDSLVEGILFRGSISVGEFYVNNSTNTVMGPAVTDAASWYDSADWVGINATPHASLVVQALSEQDGDHIRHVLVDYDVPMNDGRAVPLKAINWPKIFVISNLTPCTTGEEPRAKCLTLLTQHGVPRGTESKYFKTMKFYDYCIALRKEDLANPPQPAAGTSPRKR